MSALVNIVTSQVTAVLTGDSITTVAREELCGYVVSPGTIEHSIMEEMFVLRSVPELYNKD
jgi:hypothetical protein